MRNSTVLAKIRTGKAAKICQLGHMVPSYVAFAAHAGFDGIWLDLEHQPMDNREVQTLLAFSHLYDIDVVVRVPTREKTRLYRFLEDGAAGLIIPHVSTEAEARDLVQKTKFPPVGDRGLAPPNLQANFGLDTLDGRQALVDHTLRETFLIVQIETPLAVANLESIAAVPGLDGLFIGPADLGLRMQYEPEDRQIPYEATLKQTAAVCQAHDKFWATMPRTVEQVREETALGAQFLVWGSDNQLLMAGLDQRGKELDENSDKPLI